MSNRLLAKIKSLKKQVSQKKVQKKTIKVATSWEEFVSTIPIRSGGEIKYFYPYEYQKLLIGLIGKYKHITVVKTRQLGTTQSLVGYVLHEGAKNPAYSASLFLQGDDEAEALRERLTDLAEGAAIERARNKERLIKLVNGAEFSFHNSEKQGNRSRDSVCFLLFDEAAFTQNIESIYSASTASTSLVKNAKIVIVSTPYARSGWYWDMLNRDNNTGMEIEEICEKVGELEIYSDGLPGWFWFEDGAGNCKVFIHWKCHREYALIEDFVAKKQQEHQLSEEVAQREYNLKFLEPAVEIFPAELVRKAESDSLPKEGRIASLGVFHSDKNVAVVAIDIQGNVVYLNRESGSGGNRVLNLVSKAIGEVAVVRINVRAVEGGCAISRRIREEFSLPTIEILDGKIADLITNLELDLQSEKVKIPKPQNSKDVLSQQLRDFQRIGKKFSPAQGKDGDLVFALALANWERAFIGKGRSLPFATSS